MKGYRKVLIAVNGSKKVLTEGLKLAGDEKCWVTVVKVLPPHEGDLELVGIRDIESVLDSGAPKAASEIRDIAAAEGAFVRTRLEEGDVHRRIVEVAEEERCDLIIMGARKVRKGLARLFGDNTVARVIDQAPCPVLIVEA